VSAIPNYERLMRSAHIVRNWWNSLLFRSWIILHIAESIRCLQRD